MLVHSNSSILKLHRLWLGAAFAPLNVLSTYVIFFSSPMDDSYPWLEVVVYVIGGPVVLVGGEAMRKSVEIQVASDVKPF